MKNIPKAKVNIANKTLNIKKVATPVKQLASPFGIFLVNPNIEIFTANMQVNMFDRKSPTTQYTVFSAEFLIDLIFISLNNAINGSAQINIGIINISKMSVIIIVSIGFY